MRRLAPLLFAAALVGCSENPDARVVGMWRVDPATITISRLQPGADKRPDWTEAVTAMSGLTLKFASQPRVATASAFSKTSVGSWSLRSGSIEVKGNGEAWPQMTLDSRTPTIHLSMIKDGDQLRMDLIRDK